MLDYSQQPTAAILLIGNELLQGEIQDTNARYIAQTLGEKGIRVAEVRMIADNQQIIIDTVNELRRQVAFLFTTGGIGPTHDDITTVSIARAFGVEIMRNQEIAAQMRAHKPDISEVSLRMADVPVGAHLIANPISIAPGFRLDNVFVLAGVPSIMQAMLGNVLADLPNGVRLYSKVMYAHAPESAIASSLAELEASALGVTIGSYPTKHNGTACVRLVFRGYEPERVEAALQNNKNTLAQQGIETTH